jgi:L-proline amide hydrolase
MSDPLPVTEGYVPFRGYRTWYRVYGADTEGHAPLLMLHGGPGAAHDYLENLSELARNGRRVVFYDQLGCGKSDHPHNPSLWTPELFVEEIDAVRQALGLERVHIFGNSWGGMLGMLYALTQPAGQLSLINNSGPADVPRWVGEVNRLRAALPPEVQATLTRHETAGTTDSPEYEAATMVFYKRHVLKLAEYPDFVTASFAQIAADPEVYYTMNGPSEFFVIGTLKDWSIADRLGEIRLPTLIISGEDDEVTPDTMRLVADGIPNAEWVLLPGCSHIASAEEPGIFMATIDAFLDKVEGRAG